MAPQRLAISPSRSGRHRGLPEWKGEPENEQGAGELTKPEAKSALRDELFRTGGRRNQKEGALGWVWIDGSSLTGGAGRGNELEGLWVSKTPEL